MKHFKFLIAIFAMILLSGCGGTDKGSSSGLAVAESGIIYATDINFTKTTYNQYVGDSIKLNSLGLEISPSNANVKPTYSIDNTDVATLDANKITFVHIGQVKLTVSILIGTKTYKTSTATFNVEIKPIYASSIVFEKDYLSVDIKDTATNIMTITPVDYNKSVTVTSKYGYVDYNYITGLITPISVGSDIVTVEVDTGSDSLVKSFNVDITNYIFATDISNISFNNINIEDEVNIFVGDTVNIKYDITPSDYNMGVEILSSNDNIVITNNTFEANCIGSANITIRVQSSLGVLEKKIKVNISNPIDSIDFVLKYNEQLVDEYYTNTIYYLYVSDNIVDYSNLTIENCTYEYYQDNIFKIRFNNSKSNTIKISYTDSSDISYVTRSNSHTYNVYNVINDINLGLYFNDLELIPNHLVYTMYLPKEGMEAQAISDNQIVKANLVYSAKGIDTKPNSLSLSIVGDSVVYENGVLKAVKVGQSSITISCSDINNFSTTFYIDVLPIVANEIEVLEDNVNLYLNGDNGLDSYDISYKVLPEYCFDNTVTITTDSKIISIDNLKVTALDSGIAKVKLTCGNTTKIINFNISYVPTDMRVYFNSELVENNAINIVGLNTICNIDAIVYSNEHILKECVPTIKVDNTNIEYGVKISFNELKEYKICVTFDEYTINFVVKVKLTNPITDIKFLDDELDINRSVTDTKPLSYTVTTKIENMPTSDVLSFSSSDETIAKIEDNNIIFVGDGKVKIIASVNNQQFAFIEYTVYSKEYNYINSVEDLLNIEDNKSYIVTSDLDFTNYTSDNAINTVNCEIDFNNHKISNLSYQFFKTIENNAKIVNLIICGNIEILNSNYNNSSFFSLVCDTNNGLIDNIKFENVTFNINTDIIDEGNECYNTSLICCINDGIISNISFVNVVVNNELLTSKYNFYYSSISFNNYGTITNVDGNISIAGINRLGGIVYSNYNIIENVDMDITIICSQLKQQIGSLIYETKEDTEKGIISSISNIKIDITIECVNDIENQTIQFGGVVYKNNVCQINNVQLSIDFKVELSTSQVYLYCYSNKDKDFDSTQITATHNSVNQYELTNN